MGKTVCITGGSRGIGRAAALRFAEKGYSVAICASAESSALRETEKALALTGSPYLSVVADIGDPAACASFFDAVLQKFGTVDILINNAGRAHIGLLQDMQPEEWDALIRTDLSSVFYMSRLAIPVMLKAGHGKILNVSSVWGKAGASCETAYSAAKGGVNAFTKALAKELAPSGIQVNAISPGVIDTEMNGQLDEEERRVLEEEIPAGRFGTPEEAAELLLSLAEAGNYLTGEIIGLTGGWMC